jgi:cell wall-associated NlpC family hydrolase
MWCIPGRFARGGALALCMALSASPVCAQSRSRTVQGDGPVPVSAVRGPVARVVPVRTIVRGNDIVRSARRFVGTPYRLGGTTPRAFDCSGFVRYVFALHGISLPRTAHEQAAVGEAPAPGDSLEAGDLLFFWGGHGAQHIAIYVGGDSIIHASSTGRDVRLDRLTGGWRARRTWFNERLIAVRRMLPQEGVSYVTSSSQGLSFIPGSTPGW